MIGNASKRSILRCAMNFLTQPFKFPKKLWLVLSLVSFLYLFLSVAVNYKSNQTAWRALLDGEIGMGAVFGMFWLAVGLAFGAFVATVFGILKQLFSKSS